MIAGQPWQSSQQPGRSHIPLVMNEIFIIAISLLIRGELGRRVRVIGLSYSGICDNSMICICLFSLRQWQSLSIWLSASISHWHSPHRQTSSTSSNIMMSFHTLLPSMPEHTRCVPHWLYLYRSSESSMLIHPGIHSHTPGRSAIIRPRLRTRANGRFASNDFHIFGASWDSSVLRSTTLTTLGVKARKMR